jgi:hypothetical protein
MQCGELARPANMLREEVINSVLSEMEPECDYSSEGQWEAWYCVQRQQNLCVTKKIEKCKVTTQKIFKKVLF